MRYSRPFSWRDGYIKLNFLANCEAAYLFSAFIIQ